MKTKLLALSALLALTACSPRFLPAPPTPITPVPVVRATTNTPVYFECRSDGLLRIDADALRGKFSALAPRIKTDGIQKLMADSDALGDSDYRFELGFAQLGIMGLQTRRDAKVETFAELKGPNSKFKAALKELDPQTSPLVFFVRGDSVSTYRAVRRVALTSGFKATWELLDKDEPITFEGIIVRQEP